jgi:hypothetical protein
MQNRKYDIERERVEDCGLAAAECLRLHHRDLRLLNHFRGRQRLRGLIGQHPAAVFLDPDRDRLVLLAIDVLENGSGRGH